LPLEQFNSNRHSTGRRIFQGRDNANHAAPPSARDARGNR
jgi:hypothetical protein